MLCCHLVCKGGCLGSLNKWQGSWCTDFLMKESKWEGTQLLSTTRRNLRYLCPKVANSRAGTYQRKEFGSMHCAYIVLWPWLSSPDSFSCMAGPHLLAVLKYSLSLLSLTPWLSYCCQLCPEDLSEDFAPFLFPWNINVQPLVPVILICLAHWMACSHFLKKIITFLMQS